MNINLRSLRNLAQYAPHRVYAVILLALAVIIPSIVILAAGPDRPTYTIQTPADHITFNSIIDNPSWGDERNFVLAKKADDATNNWRDTIDGAQNGDIYTVKMLVHNNAAQNLNLVATNTRVFATIPATTGTSATIAGSLSADPPATPQKIWDEVTINSDKRFNVAIDTSTPVKYYNNIKNIDLANPYGSGFTLSTGELTSAIGAQVGYEQMDGNIPGCFQYSGFVYFNVKIYGEATAKFEATKQVRKHTTNTGGWAKSVQVNPGEQVDYLVTYKNTGETQQDNVVIKDSLPAATSYVDNTTKLANANVPSGVTLSDNNITKPVGINIGSYLPTANAFTTFTATVGKNEDLPQCGNNVLRNTATVETDNGSDSDYADVTVNKECKDQASYSCDALEATKIKELEYSFNVKLSSNMATAKEVTFDFGDGQNAVRDAKSLPITHAYAQAGQYTVKASASFDVDGKTVKDITSDACKTVINTAVTPASATGTPSTPTEIASTGPVEVFAGILGASAFGLGIQQWYASRRAVTEALSQE